MSDWLIVLLKIASMFLVILAGWVARHRNYLTAETTGTLSRFVVDLTMPAMIFAQMLRTVDADSLRNCWFVPLLGVVVLVIGQLIGMLFLPFVRQPGQRGTFVFLVAIANWVYLPLPIIQALYGNDGVRAVLLINVGAQLVLWSLGVWTLRGGKPDFKSLRELAMNPGLIATAVGVLMAVYLPISHTWQAATAVHSASMLCGGAVVQALAMVGDLTIPLSLIVTGAQLGGLDLSDHRISPTLTWMITARLLLAPAAVVLLIWGCAHLGLHLPQVLLMTTCIIAAMPVAVSCSIFTERFGGDTSLAARGIFYTTLLSIVTVPVLFFLLQQAMSRGWLP